MFLKLIKNSGEWGHEAYFLFHCKYLFLIYLQKILRQYSQLSRDAGKTRWLSLVIINI